jgi:two-component sensor histidine kinase
MFQLLQYPSIPLSEQNSAACKKISSSGDNLAVAGEQMSSQELVHSIKNQLTIVLGRAELLSGAHVDEQTQRASLEIRTAARKLSSLLQQYIDSSLSERAS